MDDGLVLVLLVVAGAAAMLLGAFQVGRSYQRGLFGRGDDYPERRIRHLERALAAKTAEMGQRDLSPPQSPSPTSPIQANVRAEAGRPPEMHIEMAGLANHQARADSESLREANRMEVVAPRSAHREREQERLAVEKKSQASARAAAKAAAEVAAEAQDRLRIDLDGVFVSNSHIDVLGTAAALQIEPSGTQTVIVFYGTDRAPTDDPIYFGGERGELSLGTVKVSIPIEHRIGRLERPKWYLFRSAVPTKHMMLLEQRSLEGNAFYSAVRAAMATDPARKPAFVFVHGYRVTFEDAALRTAQIAVDLELDTLPVFYSWPSQGTLVRYPVDAANAIWTTTHLSEFLEQFADRSGATEIFVIAHSLGTNPTSNAMAQLLVRRPDLADRFREIVLAAADIDADLFKRDIAPHFIKSRTSVTLYASSNDKALEASRKFNGNHRLGMAGEHLSVFDGVETIDASSIDTDFLAHSYYGDSRVLLTDIGLLLKGRMRPAHRFGLTERQHAHGSYWAFRR